MITHKFTYFMATLMATDQKRMATHEKVQENGKG